MPFSADEFSLLHDALLSAYPTQTSLALMVRGGLNESLETIAGTGKLTDVVLNLIEWAQAQGRESELVTQAYEKNPANVHLKAFVKAHPKFLLSTNAMPVRQTKYIPYERNVFFTGREDILERLHTLLITNKSVALTQGIVGLGGIGKTQTAIEYAYRHWDDYEAIFWCFADNDTTLNTSYRDIAARLNLPQKDAQNSEDTNNAVKAWLAANSNYLLILDNADDLAAIKKYLPSYPTGHILVTSRAHNLALLNIKSPIRLPELPADDALLFMLQRADRENASRTELIAATKLVHELGYLPLALEQAGAYIAHHELPFSDYLADYQRLRGALLEKEGPITGEYSETVRTTWNKSFDAVRAKVPAAAELLNISAFLASDAIPYELLLEGAPELGELLASELADSPDNQLHLRELLSVLTDYSLIRRIPETRAYNIHRLVQWVIQFGMDNETRRKYAEHAVLAMNTVFPQDDFVNWHSCERLLAHATACLQWIDTFNFNTPEVGDLLNRMAAYLYDSAQYSLAESILIRALTIYQKNFEPEHSKIVIVLDNLAGLYSSLARYDEALILYEQALAIRQKKLGPEHPDVATSLNNLALLYYDQADYVEAEPLFQHAFEIWQKALGPEHPHMGVIFNNLAALHRVQENYAEAESLYQRAIEIGEKALGPEHPDVATNLNNLALLYYDLARYNEAQILHKRALTIREQVLKPDHPDIAVSLNNLALLYHKQTRYGEAQILHKRALTIREQVLKPDHPDIAVSLNNLALLYYDLANYAEAEPLFQRAIEIWEKALGPEHPQVASALNNLAALHRVQENYAEAESLFQRAIEIWEKALGPEHPNLVKELEKYAMFLRESLRLIEAEALEARIVALKRG